MNLGGKQDLDALLRSWPATPPKGIAGTETEEERRWDERADVIVRAAEAAARDGAAKDAAEALFAAPALAPEAGEDTGTVGAGEKKMSQEKEPGGPPASTATPVPSQKRQSLKEIAARASQSGARSQPSASTPAPPRASMPPTPVPPPASLPRPVEAGKEDSGVINLGVVHATATAQQHADAAKAKPAQAGLFEDDKPAEKPAAAAAAAKPANVVPIQAKKSNTGAIAGVAIAVLGIAAAFAIVSRKPPAPPPAAAVQDDKAAPAATAAAPSAAPAPATATPTAVASAEPAPTAETDTKPVEAPKGPAVAMGSGAPTAAVPSADAKLAAKTPAPSGKTGDLQSEMAKAVGKDGAAKPDQPAKEDPVPAAGGPKNQNIPEQPSQGAVAAAFGPVMGGAKACVAGADDVSRASVTFSSAGTVSSVSVSGWAAANGKSGCVQAALKAAKVGPFSKPSFTVAVPIRP